MSTGGLVWTLGVRSGACSDQWLNRNFADCSRLSVPCVSAAGFPGQGVFLGANWAMRHYLPTTPGSSYSDHGGAFDGNPDIKHDNVGHGRRLVGVRPPLSRGFVSYGGQLY